MAGQAPRGLATARRPHVSPGIVEEECSDQRGANRCGADGADTRRRRSGTHDGRRVQRSAQQRTVGRDARHNRIPGSRARTAQFESRGRAASGTRARSPGADPTGSDAGRACTGCHAGGACTGADDGHRGSECDRCSSDGGAHRGPPDQWQHDRRAGGRYLADDRRQWRRCADGHRHGSDRRVPRVHDRLWTARRLQGDGRDRRSPRACSSTGATRARSSARGSRRSSAGRTWRHRRRRAYRVSRRAAHRRMARRVVVEEGP